MSSISAAPEEQSFSNLDVQFFHIDCFGQSREHAFLHRQSGIDERVNAAAAAPGRGEFLIGRVGCGARRRFAEPADAGRGGHFADSGRAAAGVAVGGTGGDNFLAARSPRGSWPRHEQQLLGAKRHCGPGTARRDDHRPHAAAAGACVVACHRAGAQSGRVQAHSGGQQRGRGGVREPGRGRKSARDLACPQKRPSASSRTSWAPGSVGGAAVRQLRWPASRIGRDGHAPGRRTAPPPRPLHRPLGLRAPAARSVSAGALRSSASRTRATRRGTRRDTCWWSSYPICGTGPWSIRSPRAWTSTRLTG